MFFFFCFFFIKIINNWQNLSAPPNRPYSDGLHEIKLEKKKKKEKEERDVKK